MSQTGSTTALPTADSGWAGEISLDLDMASAICPNCHITLVEAKSASMANLGTAVNEAVALGAEYPAASRYVTAVGGTRLPTSSTTRGWTESVWRTSSTEGTGSGCSAYDTKPAWQTDTGCAKRMIADVSAVADPATGVSVYDTYGADGQDRATYGGTSASAPIIASVYALAGTPSAGSHPSEFPYANTSALNDVTSGGNGNCTTSYFCTARTGYDDPTGLGTPEGLGAFTG